MNVVKTNLIDGVYSSSDWVKIFKHDVTKTDNFCEESECETGETSTQGCLY